MYNTTFLIISLILWCNYVESVKLEIEQGWLEGQTLVPSTGKGMFYSFKGIPYAQPPVGRLRFRAPRPPLKWKGTRNATEHSSVCVQNEGFSSKNIIGSENCLFLNVYTPCINRNNSELLPVMVFFHPGLFARGSGNDKFYAPDFLMNRGVVLVTLNYRLGVFGFLSVNHKEVPGNAGLKDQIAALRWVQKNIRNFGGDPKSVTIFGDSAGGSSVTLHMVSPAAKGLFQRAIAMSGVYLNEWALQFQPVKRAFTLCRKLGLETNDTDELLDYLEKIPAEDLILTTPDIILSDRLTVELSTTVYFTPVIENKFGRDVEQYLTESPCSLMRKGQINEADLLIGHTALEGLRYANLLVDKFLEYYPNYKELLVPRKISYHRSPLTVLKLADQIQNFYFGNQPIGSNTIKNLITYCTYSFIVYDIHAYVEQLPKISSKKRYFYEFAIYSTRNVYSKPGAMKFGIKKATHMDDLGYLFDGSGYNVTVRVDEPTYKYVQLMTKLYTNFVKFGTPTPNASLGLIWPEYDPGKNYVTIGEEGTLSTGTVSYNANTSLGFWHRLYNSTGINL